MVTLKSIFDGFSRVFTIPSELEEQPYVPTRQVRVTEKELLQAVKNRQTHGATIAVDQYIQQPYNRHRLIPVLAEALTLARETEQKELGDHISLRLTSVLDSAKAHAPTMLSEGLKSLCRIKGQEDMVAYFLDRGADPNGIGSIIPLRSSELYNSVQRSFGKTPLGLALAAGDDRTVALLTQRGAMQFDPQSTAILEQRRRETLDRIKAAGKKDDGGRGLEREFSPRHRNERGMEM